MKIFLVTSTEKTNPVEQAIQAISESLNLTINQVNYSNLAESIISQIIEEIKKSDVIIADVSNENPNVYYEIGIAHSFNKPVILLSHTDNFNRFSLLSSRFYKYETKSKGIKNLAFYLTQVLTNQNEIEELKPLETNKRNLDFQNISDKYNGLQEILGLSGVDRARKLELWVYELLKEIPGIEVEKGFDQKDGEYDFIIWNSTSDKEVEGLGNPIPIEVKAKRFIGSDTIHALTSKANLQGFKSIILITTAKVSNSNRKVIRDLKVHTGLLILVIDITDLEQIHNSKDLFDAIKTSYRKYFNYY